MGSSPTSPTNKKIGNMPVFLYYCEMSHFVYFLESIRHGRYYVGTTDKDPHQRLIEHNSGSNTWTRQNGPFRLAYFEEYCCKEDAVKREQFYKTGIGRLVRDAILRAVSAKGGPAFGGG